MAPATMGRQSLREVVVGIGDVVDVAMRKLNKPQTNKNKLRNTQMEHKGYKLGVHKVDKFEAIE